MNTLGKQILSQSDLPIKAVATPEWEGIDGKVFVRVLNLSRRIALLGSFKADDDDGVHNMVALVVETACDGDGQLLFTTEDAEALHEQSGLVIWNIAQASHKLNGLTSDAADEAVKNSKETTTDDSPSS